MNIDLNAGFCGLDSSPGAHGRSNDSARGAVCLDARRVGLDRKLEDRGNRALASEFDESTLEGITYRRGRRVGRDGASPRSP